MTSAITSQVLKEFVENNPKLVKRRESTTYPGLFVIKYSRDVFFKNLWTDILVECRGLVVDADYNPVVQPFTKIFNRFENGTDIPLTAEVTSIKKINGFMAAVTNTIDHGIIVSTTGSLDSDFVALAKKWLTVPLLTASDAFKPGMTWLFEIVDPSDPHIIAEEPGAYLIGARRQVWRGAIGPTYISESRVESSLDDIAEMMKVHRPSWKYDTFINVVEEAKTCKHEGFVVYDNNNALKIKSPYYLVSKLFGRMGSEKLVKGLENPVGLKQRIDEEFFPVIDYLTTIKNDFIMMDEQQKIASVQKFIEESLYV